MTASFDYALPKVWTWNKPNGGRFANINRPIAGPTHDKDLPVGHHPLQLYSQGTPNGVKVTVMLEELLALDHSGAEYDAWLIRIDQGDQFGSGFVALNPTPRSRLWWTKQPDACSGIRVWCHLDIPREKFGVFLPTENRARANAYRGCSGSREARLTLRRLRPLLRLRADQDRICDRSVAMEAKRQLDVLDRRLEANEYIAGSDYTIADIAVWPWYAGLTKGWLYQAAEFLQAQEYKT